MKKNNQGFMLAEAIITSVVIATAMIAFYTTYNKIFSLNKERSKYYDIDGVYASKLTFDYLYKQNNFNLFINNIFGSNHYKIIIDDNTCFYNNQIYNKLEDELNYNNATICNAIRESYNINTMIIAEYDKSVLEKDIQQDPNLTQTFKDYIKFVGGYYDVSEHNTRYSYLILTEIKNDNNDNNDQYYYASIGVE